MGKREEHVIKIAYVAMAALCNANKTLTQYVYAPLFRLCIPCPEH